MPSKLLPRAIEIRAHVDSLEKMVKVVNKKAANRKKELSKAQNVLVEALKEAFLLFLTKSNYLICH